MKLKPEDLQEFIDELNAVEKAHRDVICEDERIRRPFLDTLNAAKIKHEHLESVTR